MARSALGRCGPGANAGCNAEYLREPLDPVQGRESVAAVTDRECCPVIQAASWEVTRLAALSHHYPTPHMGRIDLGVSPANSCNPLAARLA